MEKVEDLGGKWSNYFIARGNDVSRSVGKTFATDLEEKPQK